VVMLKKVLIMKRVSRRFISLAECC
jgi:hypothetical protein